MSQSPRSDESIQVDSLLKQPTTSDDQVVDKAAKLLEQERFRTRTKELIVEYTDTVPFMEKVQKYADKQIDTRIFKSVGVVLGLLVGWVASIVIAVIIAKTTK